MDWNEAIRALLALAAAYLLGSIPFGYLVVRWWKGIDIREFGSGRTGGTNVSRAAGYSAAFTSGIADAFKAYVAVRFAQWLGTHDLVIALAGVAAVLGHNYSIFLRYRGGAGTSTSIGSAAALWCWNLAILSATLVITARATKRASLGSIAVAMVLLVTVIIRMLLGGDIWTELIHALLTSVLTLWALRPNIERLIRGEERELDTS